MIINSAFHNRIFNFMFFAQIRENLTFIFNGIHLNISQMKFFVKTWLNFIHLYAILNIIYFTFKNQTAERKETLIELMFFISEI